MRVPRLLESLRKVGDDVVYVLDADGDADHVLAHARCLLLRLRELLVGGGRRVDHQSLGVADVGELRRQAEGVDELGAGAEATLDAEGEHRAVAVLAEVFVRLAVEGVVAETRVVDPGHHGVRLEVPGERHRVPAVALHAEAERLQAEEEVERSERVLAHADIAESLDAAAHDERDVDAQNAGGSEGVPEPEAVVPGRRLGEDGVLAVVPVHGSAVDDHAADGGSVAADPLGGGLDDDVGAVPEGLAHVPAAAEGVVADERDAVLGRDGLERAEVRDGEAGVTDGLHVEGLGVGVDEGLERRGLVVLGELDVDAEPGEGHLELVVGAAVQGRGGHDVVALLTDGGDGEELRGHTGGHGDGAHAALERGDALLEHVVGGVLSSIADYDINGVGSSAFFRGGRKEALSRW